MFCSIQNSEHLIFWHIFTFCSNFQSNLSFQKGYFGEEGLSFGFCSWRWTSDSGSVNASARPSFYLVQARARVHGDVEQLLATWSATCPFLLRSPTPIATGAPTDSFPFKSKIHRSG